MKPPGVYGGSTTQRKENTMHYQPQTNDYVKYNTLVGNHLEGWIYWIDPEKRYLTLEIMVREKSEESYKDCVLHRNERCLVCVYPENWNRLEYVRSR